MRKKNNESSGRIRERPQRVPPLEEPSELRGERVVAFAERVHVLVRRLRLEAAHYVGHDGSHSGSSLPVGARSNANLGSNALRRLGLMSFLQIQIGVPVRVPFADKQ